MLLYVATYKVTTYICKQFIWIDSKLNCKMVNNQYWNGVIISTNNIIQLHRKTKIFDNYGFRKQIRLCSNSSRSRRR
jgi:hypothetical protein